MGIFSKVKDWVYSSSTANRVHPLVAREEEEIFSNNQKLIAHTKKVFGHFPEIHDGLSKEALFDDVIRNFAHFTLGIPASEGYHHAQKYGLIKHSLQVANRALRVARNQHLPSKFPLDIERNRKKRFHYAAWLCGLMHDIGKAHTDMIVFDAKDEENAWIPIKESMAEWVERNNVEKYYVKWRRDRLHQQHEMVGFHFFDKVLTDASRTYIAGCPDDLMSAIADVLVRYSSKEGYLHSSVRIADRISTASDISIIWDKELGPRKAAFHEKIILTMQKLGDNWLERGHLINVDDEIYIRWPTCFEETAKELTQYDKEVPANANEIRRTLAKRHIIQGFENDEYGLFFEGVPDDKKALDMLAKQETKNGKGLLRVEWPIHVLGEKKPFPPKVYGLMKTSMEGSAILFTQDNNQFISVDEVTEHRATLDKAASEKTANSAPANENEDTKKQTEQKQSSQVNKEKAKTEKSKPNKPAAKNSKKLVKPKPSDNPLLQSAHSPSDKSDDNKSQSTDNKATTCNQVSEQTSNSEAKSEIQIRETPQRGGTDFPAWFRPLRSRREIVEVIPAALEQGTVVVKGSQAYLLVDDTFTALIDDKLCKEIYRDGYFEAASPMPHMVHTYFEKQPHAKLGKKLNAFVMAGQQASPKSESTPTERKDENHSQQSAPKKSNKKDVKKSQPPAKKKQGNIKSKTDDKPRVAKDSQPEKNANTKKNQPKRAESVSHNDIVILATKRLLDGGVDDDSSERIILAVKQHIQMEHIYHEEGEFYIDYSVLRPNLSVKERIALQKVKLINLNGTACWKVSDDQ